MQPGKNLLPGGRYLRKFTDWSPKSGNSTLADTGHKASLPLFGQYFGGARGVFYEVTPDGVLKSYKDNTSTGGALLTPVKTYGSGWDAYKRIFSSTTPAGRILGQTSSGAIEVYQQSSPSTGGGTLTKAAAPIAASSPAAVAIKSADDVWGFDGYVYTLENGTVTRWDYSEDSPAGGAAGFAPRIDSPTIFATGLTGAKTAWMPGPGVLYTNSGSEDYSGVVKSYAGSPLTLKNDDVMTGLYGESFPDAYSCLSDQTIDKPFGDLPREPVLPPQEPTQLELPAPTGPTTVSGKITLGDGKPAPGLPVDIEASDPALLKTDGSETVLPKLGTVTTAADGTWSFTLPEQLPSAVDAAADANGGIVRLSASAKGRTSSGVDMFAVDEISVLPASKAGGAKAVALSAAMPKAHKAALLPEAKDEPQPTAMEMGQTFAAEAAKSGMLPDPSEPSPVPEWQSDRGPSPEKHDPYIVDGVNVRSEPVMPHAAPMAGGCYIVTIPYNSTVAYTTVGEAHAYWDAYAGFEYEAKLSTIVDTAIKSGSDWTYGGGVTLGSSAGSSSGYMNRGTMFAKGWRVPFQYVQQKKTYYCGAVARSSWHQILATKFWIPKGGKPGTYGADVRYLDGRVRYGKSNPNYRTVIDPGSTFQLQAGRSTKYSLAVGVFGLTLGAQTQYDADHKQRITMGVKNEEHAIWGLRGRAGNPGSEVFYSY
ncbi:hypothetical protein ACWCQL_30890 [Streptomyces sp. NPDC002073]